MNVVSACVDDPRQERRLGVPRGDKFLPERENEKAEAVEQISRSVDEFAGIVEIGRNVIAKFRLEPYPVDAGQMPLLIVVFELVTFELIDDALIVLRREIDRLLEPVQYANEYFDRTILVRRCRGQLFCRTPGELGDLEIELILQKLAFARQAFLCDCLNFEADAITVAPRQ